MEQRANIKFCVKLGKTFSETYELMHKVYGDDCLARSNVYNWLKRFKNGREDLNDDERPGRPEASNRAELVEKVRDGNFTVRMLAEELNSSTGTIWEILTDDLGKRKVCARFVPHQLNEDQKIARVEHCKDIISTGENDPDFLDSIITGDETWCFKYGPETKRQSAE
ncbi:protein GVQW3-like [Anastrepha obliqua]|uniref:protein GVQW3-like n=1 Tax=Anastrepha obliqua TaxID=95512 RepID=UPI00240A430A|nr:protein GVQW3-like [Anastrepha obliqua]